MNTHVDANYILCHKDIRVLRFSMSGQKVHDISRVYNEKHLPVGSARVHGDTWKNFFGMA